MAKKSARGFTLVETLVSLGVLMSFFAIVTVIFSIVTQMLGEARVRTVASALATERMEQVRNLSFDDVGTQGGIPSGALLQSESINVNGQDFNISTQVIYIDDPFDDQAPTDPIPTDYKRVRIEVGWDGPFASREPVVLITDAMPDGLETIAGGGTLIISVINSSGQPVSNANVAIDNTTVNPNIDLDTITDDNGRVLLPGAPACVDCYEINVTKSGYTTDRTYSTSEVTNPLKPHSTIIEGEVSSLTFTIDEAATLQVTTTGSRAASFPAFAGVEFTLTGTTTIGTDALDEPVLKYQQQHTSGPGGILTISDLEPDTYTVTIDDPSSVNLAGTNPISPFPLLPGTTRYLTVVTEAATANSLLVVVQDVAQYPVATASATLEGPGSFIATGSAGILGDGDQGQFLFSGLSAGNYDLTVTQIGFEEASASPTVSGDTVEVIVMENE